MSRATVDLQSIRFFLGYGLIFITQSVLTILLAATVMFVIKPGLALLALLPVPFVVVDRDALQPPLAAGAAGGPAADRRADRRGRGERLRHPVVKAFAREEHMLRPLPRARSRRVFDQNVYSTRLRAFYNPLIGFLPNLGLAVVLLVGGRQVINGTPHARRLHRLLHLPDHADRADADARHRARDVAAGDRLRQPAVRDPRPRAADRAARRAPRRCPTGGGRVELRGVSLAYDGARAGARRDVDLDGRGGQDGRAGRADRLGQDEPRRRCSRGSTTRPRAAVSIDGADLRDVDLASLRSQIAFVADDSFLFCATVAENIAYARPGRDAARRSSWRRGGRRRTASSSGCPTATRRSSASAG